MVRAGEGRITVTFTGEKGGALTRTVEAAMIPIKTASPTFAGPGEPAERADVWKCSAHQQDYRPERLLFDLLPTDVKSAASLATKCGKTISPATDPSPATRVRERCDAPLHSGDWDETPSRRRCRLSEESSRTLP